MTGKLLPFARPAPRTPKPGTVVRQETTGGGSRSHCRSTPTSSHVRSPSERPSSWRTSPGRTTPGGGRLAGRRHRRGWLPLRGRRRPGLRPHGSPSHEGRPRDLGEPQDADRVAKTCRTKPVWRFYEVAGLLRQRDRTSPLATSAPLSVQNPTDLPDTLHAAIERAVEFLLGVHVERWIGVDGTKHALWLRVFR